MPPIKNPKLGKLIREAREDMGLTLRALGELSGLDFSTVAKMERGEFRAPDPVKLQKLARTLELDVEDIYALAGYTMPEGLPEFVPYLRAKYRLPEQAVAQMEAYFARISRRYSESTGQESGSGGRGGGKPHRKT